MTKLRKQRRKKVYRHNVNRKRMRNQQNKLGTITCKPIKDAWEIQKSVQRNMKEMGLAYNANEVLGIPNFKKKLKTQIIPEKGNWIEEPIEPQAEEEEAPKKHVVEALIAEAKAPRKKMFRLPKGQVEWVTYLMDKYGSDYKAMARDKKNYWQETWKQIRAKIKTFVSIPEQCSVYATKKGITVDELAEKYVNEYDSD